jgi:multiple antibiotic resistance protein
MLDFATTAFVSILFLADPPGNVPPFLALTARQTPAKRRKTALTACVVACLTLMAFGAVGTYLFRHLGLTLPAFQIAGGIILFVVALDMIRAQRTTQENPEEMEESAAASDVAVTPLAIPFIAGPATLSTVTVLMAKADGVAQMGTVYAAILLTCGLTYLMFRLAEPIQRRLGTTGIHVLGRILGLVLAGIAVQFVLDGLAKAGIIPEVPK